MTDDEVPEAPRGGQGGGKRLVKRFSASKADAYVAMVAEGKTDEVAAMVAEVDLTVVDHWAFKVPAFTAAKFAAEARRRRKLTT